MEEGTDLQLPPHYAPLVSNSHPLAPTRQQLDTLFASLIPPLSNIDSLQNELQHLASTLPTALQSLQSHHNSLGLLNQVLDMNQSIVQQHASELTAEIDSIKRVVQSNQVDWEEQEAMRDELTRNKARLQSEIEALRIQNESYQNALDSVSRPVDHSHIQEMELARAAAFMHKKPNPVHPEVLSLIQALSDKQVKQKNWMVALERDIAEIHRKGIEMEDRLAHEATLGQAVAQKRKKVEYLREEKRRSEELRRGAIQARSKRTGDLCQEKMESMAAQLSGVQGRMKGILSRMLKVVLSSKAPNDL